MDPRVRSLFTRLATDSAFAERYFANPDPALAEADIPEEDRIALRSLTREALSYLEQGAKSEPEIALEHPSNNMGNRHMTVVIALWGCACFVLAWLVLRVA